MNLLEMLYTIQQGKKVRNKAIKEMIISKLDAQGLWIQFGEDDTAIPFPVPVLDFKNTSDNWELYIEKKKEDPKENIKRVIEYLNEKKPHKYDYNTFELFLEIYSQDYTEVTANYQITYGLELFGQEDGTLKTRVLVWKDSYYPEVLENSFGRALFEKEIEKIYKEYQKGLKFAKELQSKFDFIELEK